MNTPATHRQPLSSATNSNYQRCPPEIMHRCRKVTSYALLRITLGLNICMHGIIRWAAGLRSFAESLLPMFQKTPLPAWSVYSFGCLLPIVEATVGACVLFGFQTRRALISGSVLMLS